MDVSYLRYSNIRIHFLVYLPFLEKDLEVDLTLALTSLRKRKKKSFAFSHNCTTPRILCGRLIKQEARLSAFGSQKQWRGVECFL